MITIIHTQKHVRGEPSTYDVAYACQHQPSGNSTKYRTAGIDRCVTTGYVLIIEVYRAISSKTLRVRSLHRLLLTYLVERVVLGTSLRVLQ